MLYNLITFDIENETSVEIFLNTFLICSIIFYSQDDNKITETQRMKLEKKYY